MKGNQFLSRGNNGRHIVVAIIPILALAAIAWLAFTFVEKGENPSHQGNSENEWLPPSPDLPNPTTDSLTTTRGTETREGVSVGYPKDLVGAISAAVEYTAHALSTLDPDRAATVGDVIASKRNDHDFRAAPQNSRRSLGIPQEGPVPEGYSIAVAPVAYQAVRSTDTSIDVLLLLYTTTTRPGEGPSRHIGVAPVSMTWEENDWKWAPILSDENYNDLAIEIDSPEAAALGWITITRQ